MKLTPRDEKFCQEYVVNGKSATKAYLSAYPSMKSVSGAWRTAQGVMQREPIIARIRELENDLAVRYDNVVQEIVDSLTDIALADAVELVDHKIVNCRHCWGIGFKYQYANEAEYAFEVAKMIDLQNRGKPAEIPSKEGGFGFDRNAMPNKACPACLGAGYSRVDIADTRTVTRRGRRLFAGIKYTAHGMQVLMHDQHKAKETLLKLFGLLSNDAPPVQPKPVEPVTIENMPDNQIDAMKAYQLLIKDS